MATQITYLFPFPWIFWCHGFTWDPFGRNFRRLSSGIEISLRKFALSRLSSHKFFDSFHVNPSQILICMNLLRKLEYAQPLGSVPSSPLGGFTISPFSPLGGFEGFTGLAFAFSLSPSSSPPWSACLAAKTAGTYWSWIAKAFGTVSAVCLFKDSRTWKS